MDLVEYPALQCANYACARRSSPPIAYHVFPQGIVDLYDLQSPAFKVGLKKYPSSVPQCPHCRQRMAHVHRDPVTNIRRIRDWKDGNLRIMLYPGDPGVPERGPTPPRSPSPPGQINAPPPDLSRTPYRPSYTVFREPGTRNRRTFNAEGNWVLVSDLAAKWKHRT
jgi:hypothetical protein